MLYVFENILLILSLIGCAVILHICIMKVCDILLHDRMEEGGSSEKSVRIGKNAASVFPDAVDAESSTLSSVLKMASPAAT